MDSPLLLETELISLHRRIKFLPSGSIPSPWFRKSLAEWLIIHFNLSGDSTVVRNFWIPLLHIIPSNIKLQVLRRCHLKIRKRRSSVLWSPISCCKILCQWQIFNLTFSNALFKESNVSKCRMLEDFCFPFWMSPNPGASTPMTLEKVYDAFLTQAMETASLVTSLA